MVPLKLPKVKTSKKNQKKNNYATLQIVRQQQQEQPVDSPHQNTHTHTRNSQIEQQQQLLLTATNTHTHALTNTHKLVHTPSTIYSTHNFTIHTQHIITL